jgi:hypothetical protein
VEEAATRGRQPIQLRSAAARLGAATALLDRGYGKAKQEVEIRKPNLARLTDEELDELERLTEFDEIEATAH